MLRPDLPIPMGTADRAATPDRRENDMSRNATTEIDERADALVDADEHGFWDGPNDDEPLVIPADDPTIDGEHETRIYMGQVRHTQAELDELDALADWAQGHACEDCRDALGADHDPDTLEHDDCRSALRAAGLLRRYP
jgi:hypothetical protein